MSAFEGLRAIRKFRRLHPQLPPNDLVDLIQQVDPGAPTYDFDAAEDLNAIVAVQLDLDAGMLFYRGCVEGALTARPSLWNRIITLGRAKFVGKVSRDQAQCFRAAGLLEESPDKSLRAWWDQISGVARLASDADKLARARIAEEKTMDYERARLAKLGISLEPLWIAIEDNTAGYDVKSFDPSPGEPTARLIEVKSTIVSPLRFRLTRKEWDIAVKVGNAYHFHVWDLTAEPGRLHELTLADVSPHIPSDNRKGRWENVEIPVWS